MATSKKVLKLEEKIEVIKELESGKTFEILAKKYCVSKSYIHYIKRAQTRINNKFKWQRNNKQDLPEKLFHQENKSLKFSKGTEVSKEINFFDGTKLNLEHTSLDDPTQMIITEGSTLSLDLQFRSGVLLQNDNIVLKEESFKNEAITIVTNPSTISDDESISQDTATLILSGDPVNKIEELLSLEEPIKSVLCTSYKLFQERIINFEMDTYTQYIIKKTRGNFSEKDVISVPKRLHWWKGGSLDGVPYIIVASRYYSCRYGTPTHNKMFEKYSKEREKQIQGDHHEVLREREEVRKNIHQNFRNFHSETRFTCILPDIEWHQFHQVGPSSAKKEMLDSRVLERIKMLVKSGKTNPDDIHEEIEDYANAELKIPDKQRRRFYPSRLDIINTINRIKLKIRKEELEQEKIKNLIDIWGDDSDIFWRPLKNSDPNSKFLFVYQNEEMKRLFSLYGTNSILIDGVHKVCEFVWPIYFIIVNTNFDYQVVGFFIVQHETKMAIAEGLEVIKSWNPEVEPKHAMVNGPWEEIKIIRSVYPKIKIFVSSFHRNHAWEKKIYRKENMDLDQSEILSQLNNVANASSEEKLRLALIELKESKGFNSSSMKAYYQNFWHQHLKRWAIFHFPYDLFFDVNYGFHRFKDEINYPYLQELRSLPLSVIINIIITKYIPFKLVTYRNANRSMRTYDNIPPYLSHCSKWVINQIMKINFEITQESNQLVVQEISPNKFYISTTEKNCIYEVGFYPKKRLVLCNCSVYMKTKLICKHLLIVGNQFPQWHLSKISSWLFEYQIHRVDLEIPSYVNGNVHNADKNRNTLEILNPLSANYFKSAANITNSSLENLKERCKTELRILDSLVEFLDEDHLQDLIHQLNAIRLKNSSSIS